MANTIKASGTSLKKKIDLTLLWIHKTSRWRCWLQNRDWKGGDVGTRSCFLLFTKTQKLHTRTNKALFFFHTFSPNSCWFFCSLKAFLIGHAHCFAAVETSTVLCRSTFPHNHRRGVGGEASGSSRQRVQFPRIYFRINWLVLKRRLFGLNLSFFCFFSLFCLCACWFPVDLDLFCLCHPGSLPAPLPHSAVYRLVKQDAL